MAPSPRPSLLRRCTLLGACGLALAAALPAPHGAAAAGIYPDGATGNDINWPQCGPPVRTPPVGGIDIVGLDGHPFSVNQCLDAEWAWAVRSPAQPSVYMLANFDPSQSDPATSTGNDIGYAQNGPKGKGCSDPDCMSYNWGWNTAVDAVARARAHKVVPAMWWIDVETTMNWACTATNPSCNSGDPSNYDKPHNAMVIAAMIDYLKSQALLYGIYSTALQWGYIAGSYNPVTPVWVPDWNDNNPVAYCVPQRSFGGGDVFQVQLTPNPFDGDYSCPSNHGYYLVAGDGGIFPFGSATGYGSTGGMKLNKPVVGIASNPKGRGYWVVAADGGIFPFGPDTTGYGSTGGIHLNQPVVGMAATPDGKGYWLVATDGGIFPFGDAGGYGSTGSTRLNKPIVGMAATADGKGYWLVAADGGIFPFGDAQQQSYGSAGNLTLDSPVVGMTRTVSGAGYWLVTAKGTVLDFGDAVAQAYGSWAPRPLNSPLLGIAPSA
jgi:hypothetical protein